MILEIRTSTQERAFYSGQAWLTGPREAVSARVQPIRCLPRPEEHLMPETYATVDDYIGSYPEEVKVVLAEVRRTIHNVVPAGEETISYQMPTIVLDGRRLVHFAGWKRHISIYPAPAVDEPLAQQLAPYRASKGTLKFPLDQPIPYDLIGRLVEVLVAQHAVHG